MVIGTIFCANYSAKALHLAKSIRDSKLDAHLEACIVELPYELSKDLLEAFDRISFMGNLGYDNFPSFIFRYSQLEASSCCKARLLLDLMARYPDEEVFVFLDPDVAVFSTFDELPRAFEKGDVVVTPHLAGSEASGNMLFEFLKSGTFNGGFIAVRRTPSGIGFLRWWQEQTERWGFDDSEWGLFADQKWIDMAASAFDLSVLRHVGYNVGPWNVGKRYIQKREQVYEVNGDPLRFIHFSGIKGAGIEGSERFLPFLPAAHGAHALTAEYMESLERLGNRSYINLNWSYGAYHSGEAISKEARMAYTHDPKLSTEFPNPFEASNAVLLDIASGDYRKRAGYRL